MQVQIATPGLTVNTLKHMEFASLASFNGGDIGVFWSEPGDQSPWEMHPDCDELLQVICGEIEVEVLPHTGGDGVRRRIGAGGIIVIPKGCWHRQRILEETQELYVTPGTSLHSTADDPRIE